MAKFFLGIFIGIIIAVFGSLIILFAIGKAFSEQAAYGCRSFRLGAGPGRQRSGSCAGGFAFSHRRHEQATPTVRDLWTSLHEPPPKILA